MFVFIETKLFSRLADEWLTDQDLWRLQRHLSDRPDAGDIIPGSGGVRKLRWPTAGRGKRGALRVLYYLRSKQGEIWLLTLYAKNTGRAISARALKRIKGEIDG